MTPKEKAASLVLNYMSKVVSMNLAKECAIIAVNEIMKMGWNLAHYGNQEGYNYWYLVKQEIEKL
jgi:hypothetical protein